jgi:UDP-N-acetylmuramyl pentapeptide phosphotransferase/UDP-N-acetylglucosamine-1-phosphate transferase
MQIDQMTNILIMTATISFMISVLIVCTRRYHGQYSLDNDLNGIQKNHVNPVPRVGGIAVVVGILTSLIFLKLFPIVPALKFSSSAALLLLAAATPAFFAGIVEDLTKKVSVRGRLLATFSSALIASALLGATVDHLDIIGIDALIGFPPVALVITAIVVGGGANAVNIIDGFNGLSGSVVVAMAAALGFVAWRVNDTFVLMLSLLCIGAAIGFLLVNYPTGKLFLGDGGAYFLGFWVSEIAVLLLARNPSVNAWQVLAICAYPVIEVLYSIYRRKILSNASPGDPDGLHLHSLVYRQVVSRLTTQRAGNTWGHNAAVVCIILPFVAVFEIASVVLAQTIVGGIFTVLAQAVTYIVLYRRLIRGRCNSAPFGRNSIEIDMKHESL